jgi:hypothetical protein
MKKSFCVYDSMLPGTLKQTGVRGGGGEEASHGLSLVNTTPLISLSSLDVYVFQAQLYARNRARWCMSLLGWGGRGQ